MEKVNIDYWLFPEWIEKSTTGKMAELQSQQSGQRNSFRILWKFSAQGIRDLRDILEDFT